MSLFRFGAGSDAAAAAVASPTTNDEEPKNAGSDHDHDPPATPGTLGTPDTDGATALARLLAENAALLAELRTGTATAEMCLRAKELSTAIKTMSLEKEARKSTTKA